MVVVVAFKHYLYYYLYDIGKDTPMAGPVDRDYQFQPSISGTVRDLLTVPDFIFSVVPAQSGGRRRHHTGV